MEHFQEEVVRRHNCRGTEILYYLIVVLSVAAALLGVLGLVSLILEFSVIVLAASLALGVASVVLWLTRGNLRPEYDYTFVSGAMDFALVLNNRKRRELGKFDVEEAVAFGKVGGDSYARHTAGDVKQLRLVLNEDAALYYLAFSKQGQKTVVVLEPSEKMVDCIRQYLPHGAWQEN